MSQVKLWLIVDGNSTSPISLTLGSGNNTSGQQQQVIEPGSALPITLEQSSVLVIRTEPASDPLNDRQIEV